MEKHANQNLVENLGKLAIFQIFKTLNHFFKGNIDELSTLPDPREKCHYDIDEIVMSGISMFLFMEGSRNAFNNDRKDSNFQDNYSKAFGMELAHMDTVKDVFCKMEPDSLEQYKANMISGLIRKKLFTGYRYGGKYKIAVDGTGIVSFDKPHCPHCLTKTSKTGKVTYFHNVLEAKLIAESGFCLSIASEWIINEDNSQYHKQDCEREAFKRLAKKIKKYYPRLPIIIIADGLYPYQGFFDVCLKYKWNYIVTLKDKSLKRFQEEITWNKCITPYQKHQTFKRTKTHIIKRNHHWLERQEYNSHLLNWVECIEEDTYTETGEIKTQKFVHLTDLDMSNDTCAKISLLGRLRQKIENEGFNCQKNNGYNLEHKYVRCDFNAMKNFYQCLQIAHIINQLVILSQTVEQCFKDDGKLTVKYLWKRLLSYMLEVEICRDEITGLLKTSFQIRLC